MADVVADQRARDAELHVRLGRDSIPPAATIVERSRNQQVRFAVDPGPKELAFFARLRRKPGDRKV
jgi:hypothetical protein